MSSLVLELQRDCLNPDTQLAGVLRKALVIASKLNVPELAAWLENELAGYSDRGAVPPYRVARSEVAARDHWGNWVPVIFETNEVLETIARVRFYDSVAEIQALAQRANSHDGRLTIAFTPEQMRILSTNSENGLMMHTRFVRAEDLNGVLDVVRTEILKWTLKLERDGILGEGMSFSQEEEQRAAAIHYTTTNFFGDVGNLAQHSHDFRQTANLGIRPQDLATLTKELTNHLDELDLGPAAKRKVEAQIATLKAQLTDDPDPVIVQQAGRTLRSITEGAIASLVASAVQPTIWYTIQNLLSLFPHR
jgi:AbiTii